MIITIDIPDEMAAVLTEHLSQLTQPLRIDPATGGVLSGIPLFPKGSEVPEWVSKVIATNIANTLRERPTLEMLAIQQEIAERQQRIEGLFRPAVSASASVSKKITPE